MPYGMPYGNDMMTAMSGIASGRPRRRLGPMPGDLENMPGSVRDPVFRGRARNPGRRRQGTIPMIPPFTDPVGGGGMFLPGMGGRRRQSRFRDFPVHGLLQPQVPQPIGMAPQLPTMSPGMMSPGAGNLPGMGAMDLFGSGGFGFGG